MTSPTEGDTTGNFASAPAVLLLTFLVLDFGRALVLAISASSKIAERLSTSSRDRKEGLEEQRAGRASEDMLENAKRFLTDNKE